MNSKHEAGESLDSLIKDVGIPNELVYDGAGKQVGRNSKFDQSIRHYRISKHITEPFSPWQNKAESDICIMKARWKYIYGKAEGTEKALGLCTCLGCTNL
jgi:transposase